MRDYIYLVSVTRARDTGAYFVFEHRSDGQVQRYCTSGSRRFANFFARRRAHRLLAQQGENLRLELSLLNRHGEKVHVRLGADPRSLR